MRVVNGFTETEEKWLQMLFEPQFAGKGILMSQLREAGISRERLPGGIFLKFKVHSDAERFPYGVRVPVEMIARQKEGGPVDFLMHVVGGFVDELEVYKTDSSNIDPETVELDQVEHYINEAVLPPGDYDGYRQGVGGGYVQVSPPISDSSPMMRGD